MAKAVKRVVYRKKAALKATKAALKAGWRMEDGRTRQVVVSDQVSLISARLHYLRTLPGGVWRRTEPGRGPRPFPPRAPLSLLPSTFPPASLSYKLHPISGSISQSILTTILQRSPLKKVPQFSPVKIEKWKQWVVWLIHYPDNCSGSFCMVGPLKN